jgi:hypothetical protein
MQTARIHTLIVKLVATGGTLLSLLTLSALPALTKAGTITEFALPTAKSRPQNIVSGPDGNLWLTEYGLTAKTGDKIGRVTAE